MSNMSLIRLVNLLHPTCLRNFQFSSAENLTLFSKLRRNVREKKGILPMHHHKLGRVHCITHIFGTVTCRIPSVATDSTLSVMPGEQAYDGTYMR